MMSTNQVTVFCTLRDDHYDATYGHYILQVLSDRATEKLR